MNHKNVVPKVCLILMFCVLITATLQLAGVTAASISNLVTFNTTSELATYFNDDSSPQFSNISSEGISNTGAINVPSGSNDIWTTKQGYSVAGTGDKYTFSAFFKIKENAGYGGLGFSDADTNTTDEFGSPAHGVGVYFHGGGGAFVNNRADTILDWYTSVGDLELGGWYKMIFEVTAVGTNTYDLTLQIWNSDENGVVGTLFTEQSLTDVVNSDLGGASIIHGYFSAAGDRMEKIDNFLMNLEGGATFVESGLPVVLTNSASAITETSLEIGGNVTDEQGAEVTDKGVCWSTSVSPNLMDDDCTNNGTGLGEFSATLSSLLPETTYYIRAYATNSEGTSYGSEMIVETEGVPSTPTPSPSNKPKVIVTSARAATPIPTPTVTQVIESPVVTPTVTVAPSAQPLELHILGVDGLPVKQTKVSINSKEYTTDVSGKIAIQTLSSGDYTIELTLDGKTYTQKFVLGEQTTGVVTVKLEEQVKKKSYSWIWLLVLILVVIAGRKVVGNERERSRL